MWKVLNVTMSHVTNVTILCFFFLRGEGLIISPPFPFPCGPFPGANGGVSAPLPALPACGIISPFLRGGVLVTSLSAL